MIRHQQTFAKRSDAMPTQRLHLISNAHLDPVWLWSWRDGFAEVLTTLQSAADRLREYPRLRYTCSAAYAYRWVKEIDPRLFREIRTFIEEGRWEVVGGWVVQADTLHPSEFSLRRQGLLAQEWFRDNLGVTARIGYCVDSFGHSAGLPSMLAGAGMRYYVFQRPHLHERPDLPNLFWWEAPDGARVLTWRLACGYGQGPGCTAAELENSLRNTWRELLAPDMPVGTWFVGVGNHGGGPTRIQLDHIGELRDSGDPSLPELRFSTLAEFFAEVERQPNFAAVPVIRGELLHHTRGCYAANTRFKRLHRQTERELRIAENLLAMRENRMPVTSGAEPPPDSLRVAWWALCFNQFHDILPGTSVAPAYEEVRDHLGGARHAARQATVAAVHALARRADNRGAPEGVLFLANPLPWARTALVRLDTFVSPHGDSPITHLAGTDGENLPLQWSAAEAGFGPFLKEWKKLVAAVPLPACAARRFHLAHGEATLVSRPVKVDARLSAFANSAKLVVLEDRADTWGHDTNRWDRVLGGLTLEREKQLDDGPIFRRHRRWLAWGKSSVIMDTVEWHALDALELVLHINWQDRYQALKLELPLPAPDTLLHVRTPGAVVERPLDGDESFWGEWLTLAAAGQRLLVAGDGAAAYDATPERLRLTLLRCVPHAQHQPVPHPEDSPAPFLDEGYQEARFWLASPGAEESEADLDRLAAGLLAPAEQMLDSVHDHTDGSVKYSMKNGMTDLS
jgi:alpha-mannosidase